MLAGVYVWSCALWDRNELFHLSGMFWAQGSTVPFFWSSKPVMKFSYWLIDCLCSACLVLFQSADGQDYAVVSRWAWAQNIMPSLIFCSIWIEYKAFFDQTFTHVLLLWIATLFWTSEIFHNFSVGFYMQGDVVMHPAIVRCVLVYWDQARPARRWRRSSGRVRAGTWSPEPLRLDFNLRGPACTTWWSAALRHGGGGTTTTTSQFMVHRRHAGKGAGLQNALTARRPQVNVHGGATFCHSDFFLVSPTGFTHGTHAAALLATC